MGLLNALVKHRPQPPQSPPLADVILASVRRMAEESSDVAQEAAELAFALRERAADYREVRAIAHDIVYEGDVDASEKLMGLLARYGFGNGSITAQQPEPITRSPEPTPAPAPKIAPDVPQLCRENILAELATPEPYAAIILGDRGTGRTTLLQALIGARLRLPCPNITITVMDLVSEPDWKGLASVPNTLAVLPSRDPIFLERCAEYIGEVAKEVQLRSSQRTLNHRSPSIGKKRFPAYFLAINGWEQVTEVLSLLTPTQLQHHEQADQLLKDIRYVLSTGPKVGLSVVAVGDRLDNLLLSETSLDTARIFALGASFVPGVGGYRCIDAILQNKRRLPDSAERSRLRELLSDCKQRREPVVLALSGTPRLGRLNDFRDDQMKLGEMYRQRRELSH